ncbi:MAG: hypothetical protein JWO56_1018 [Acidobacteria bacterium]|nr:hypothetical protein [Acidobacteriota bacterium]
MGVLTADGCAGGGRQTPAASTKSSDQFPGNAFVSARPSYVPVAFV